VLVLDKEFPSCTTPFLRAGCKLSFLKTDPSGYFDADMLRVHLRDKPQLFVLSSVQFGTGFRAELRQLGEVCRQNGVRFVVDASQSAGAFPIDLEDAFVDALVFTGCKWATAGYGIAVLATGCGWPEEIPPLVGWRSARDAYALENDRLDILPGGIGHEMGHPPFPGIFAMGAAVDVLSQQGIEAIAERIRELIGQLRAALQDRGIAIRSHGAPEHQSGILLADLPDAEGLCRRLRDREVWTSSRCGGLRVSVHGYNTKADVTGFLDALDDAGIPTGAGPRCRDHR